MKFTVTVVGELIMAVSVVALIVGLSSCAQAQTAPVTGDKALRIPLGPDKFNKRPDGQQLTIIKTPSYGAIRFSCKSDKAVACTIYNTAECIVMLGPKVHDNPRALQHELHHCAGWSPNHEDARYD